MARTRSLMQIALTLAVTAALTSCNDAPSPNPTSMASSSTTTSASTPTTTSLSPEERDERDAGQAVTKLWSQLDRLAGDPALTLNSLVKVARDQALAQWQTNLSDQRARQWKQIGNVTIATLTTSYSGSNLYKVAACIDVSKVNVVDTSGKSVLSAGRADRTKYTYEVTKSADEFFVTKDMMKGSSC